MAAHALQPASEACHEQVTAKRLPVTPSPEAQAAAQLRRLRGRMSQAQLAEAVGVSPAMVKRWENPRDLASPSLRHIAQFPAAMRDALAAELTHDDGPAVDPGRACLVAQRELGEATGAWLDAAADGVITDAERRRARAEAADVVRAALRLLRAVG